MQLDLLYFSWVREARGCGDETVDVPDDVTTVQDLLAWLHARNGDEAIFAQGQRLRFALDQVFAPVTASLIGVKEVAIFPPVNGG